jgi:lysyl-tRNA synthetase class I
MLVKISQTWIFNTDSLFAYQLNDKGLLIIFDDYRNFTDNHGFKESMQIWRQLLEQLVVQHSQYLAILHNLETSRKLAQDYNKQIFDEFTQLEQKFRQIHDDEEREYQARARQELIDEGIDVADLEF